MRHQRSSIALFLAATGLIAGVSGCGAAPSVKAPQTPAAGQPEPDGRPAVKYHNNRDGQEGGEGGEGGEG